MCPVSTATLCCSKLWRLQADCAKWPEGCVSKLRRSAHRQQHAKFMRAAATCGSSRPRLRALASSSSLRLR